MKSKKRSLLFAILCGMLTLSILAACSGGGTVSYNVIRTQQTYTPYERPMTGAEIDEEIVLDGVFDESFYEGRSWFRGNKQVGTRTATMDVTAYLAHNGLLIAVDVDENWLVSYNPLRVTSNNSCAELYVAMGDATIADGSLWELDVTAHGEYRYRVWKNYVNTFDFYEYTYETSPSYAIQLKGGTISSGKCTGYAIEMFIPWTFFGRSIRPDSVYINPTLITPIFDTGSDRDWYCFGVEQSPSICRWGMPAAYVFDKNGFVCNEIEIQTEGGTVKEQFGREWCVDNDTVKFYVTPESGKKLSSLTVNGSDYTSAAAGGEFDVKCRGDIVISAVFA